MTDKEFQIIEDDNLSEEKLNKRANDFMTFPPRIHNGNKTKNKYQHNIGRLESRRQETQQGCRGY